MGITFSGLENNNAYVEWCNSHPNGYVLNKRNKSTLHRATCKTVTRHGRIDSDTSQKHKVATSSCAKVCYETREEMLAELGAKDINRCGHCKP